MSSFHLVSHFYNEALLLPYWVKHHLPLFETATLINHRSTDDSIEVIKALAPHWRIVDTQMKDFTAAQLEPEVQHYESLSKADYKLVLNTTEFVFDLHFRETVEDFFAANPVLAMGMKSVVMVDPPKTSSEHYKDPMWDFIADTNPPLWLEHRYGYVDPGRVRRWRYVHRAEHGHYHLGRHGTFLPAAHKEDSYLQWFGWAPYPECRERKLQIQTQMSPGDKAARLGFEHLQTPESLTALYQEHLAKSYDLLTDSTYFKRYDEYIVDYLF